METIIVLQKLFEARDQIHALHLNTRVYSEHKALNEFYDEWLDLLDSFVETYQGAYGRIEGVMKIIISTSTSITDYLIGIMSFLDNDIISIVDQNKDTDLLNIIADMKQLVNHTQYLLTLK